MGCHQCWTEAYKQQRKKQKKDRVARGDKVRKQVYVPIICPCCGQAMNSKNEAQEVFNAKRNI